MYTDNAGLRRRKYSTIIFETLLYKISNISTTKKVKYLKICINYDCFMPVTLYGTYFTPIFLFKTILRPLQIEAKKITTLKKPWHCLAVNRNSVVAAKLVGSVFRTVFKTLQLM